MIILFSISAGSSEWPSHVRRRMPSLRVITQAELGSIIIPFAHRNLWTAQVPVSLARLYSILRGGGHTFVSARFKRTASHTEADLPANGNNKLYSTIALKELSTKRGKKKNQE